jgi:phosphoribosylglycinamide formyltransferase-1
VLVSGGGTNLQAIMNAVAAGQIPVEIACVISDKPGVFGLERARRAGIATREVPFAEFGTRAEFDNELARVLAAVAPDFIALAGYMRIIDSATVTRYAGQMLNIHPSLLPAYPGLHTYARALAAGEHWHGTTVHFVTPELDAGPGIVQYRVPVTAADTEQTLQEKVQRGEYRIYPRALQWLVTGRVRLVAGQVIKDGSPLQSPVIVEAVT